MFHVGTTKVRPCVCCAAGAPLFLPVFEPCREPSLMACVERLIQVQVEAQLKAHLKNVRALDYNHETNTLVTCSFDKTVKVFT